jgi:hypothetical protein
LTQITENPPVVGDPNSTFDPATTALLASLVAKWNGNIDKDNLLPAEAVRLGVTSTSVTRRATATVATLQTTTSATYANLGTVGPEVTLVLEPLVPCLILINVDARISAGGGTASIGYHVNSVLPTFPFHGKGSFPNDAANLAQTTSGSVVNLNTVMPVIPSLTQGSPASYTFTLKYKVSGGATAEYQNRVISVVSFKV